MSIRNPTIAAVTSPTLLDLAINQVNASLSGGLSWLTTAYGKAERRERLRDTARVLYPAIYTGSGEEYLSMLPDEHLGRYTWWDIEDPQPMDWQKNQLIFHRVRFGLVLWGDIRSIYPADHEARTTEHIKAEVLSLLNRSAWPNVSLRVEEIWERSENVYRGYTVSEVENQFEMRPYFALRFAGEMKYHAQCTPG